jgi:hypothetical protein
MKAPKRPLRIEVDTPNVDVNFDRNEAGDRVLQVKTEKIPLIEKVRQAVKLIRGKVK